MSSTEEDSSGEYANDNQSNINAYLVDKIKSNKILLQKCQLPLLRIKKEELLEKICVDLKEKYKLEINKKNVIKKIANMKCRAKQKSDINKTGNRKIVLKNWEKGMIELLSEKENPAINKVEGMYVVFLINCIYMHKHINYMLYQ